MKYDIVVKKREVTRKDLENTARIVYQLNRLHIPQDICKKYLMSILGNIGTQVTSDFDCPITSDPEDPSVYREKYTEMNFDMISKLDIKIRKLRKV